MIYWVYILECSNGNYYTGYTIDLVRRYQEHLSGTAKCKYTRSFKPRALAQCWQVLEDKSLALKAERHLKGLSKEQKLAYISDPERLCAHFPKLKPGSAQMKRSVSKA